MSHFIHPNPTYGTVTQGISYPCLGLRIPNHSIKLLPQPILADIRTGCIVSGDYPLIPLLVRIRGLDVVFTCFLNSFAGVEDSPVQMLSNGYELRFSLFEGLTIPTGDLIYPPNCNYWTRVLSLLSSMPTYDEHALSKALSDCPISGVGVDKMAHEKPILHERHHR